MLVRCWDKCISVLGECVQLCGMAGSCVTYWTVGVFVTWLWTVPIFLSDCVQLCGMAGSCVAYWTVGVFVTWLWTVPIFLSDCVQLCGMAGSCVTYWTVGVFVTWLWTVPIFLSECEIYLPSLNVIWKRIYQLSHLTVLLCCSIRCLIPTNTVKTVLM
jgi:hypothetical protein